jgi:hypothetical protein
MGPRFPIGNLGCFLPVSILVLINALSIGKVSAPLSCQPVSVQVVECPLSFPVFNKKQYKNIS